MSKIVSLSDVESRDEQIYRDRLSGLSLKKIARKYEVSEAVALAAIDRHLTPIDQQMRKNTLQLELDRLDEIEHIFHAKMLEGDGAAAHLMLKIKELRADYTGIRAPVRVDAIQQTIEAEQGTSTDRIQAALYHVAGHRLPKFDELVATHGNEDPEPT